MKRPDGGDPFARERSRALAARKLLPWVVASGAGAAALVKVAGATWGGAAGFFGAGLLAAVFVWTLSIARCPFCGRPLPRPGAARAASRGARGCERCSGASGDAARAERS
jgi:hypothetical protein